MPGFHLYTSNRLEILVDRLAEVLVRPLSSPLDMEVVVVQSKGMERWISMEIARRHGICANYRFPFPNAYVYEIFAGVLGDLPDPSPFDPSILTWKIMKQLPSCIMKPQFEGLRNYLADDPAHLKQFQLAQRIASLFDQYLLYRPDMILRWERAEENHWQSVLWHELSSGQESLQRPALREAFLAALRNPSATLKNLPERLSVFGISSLPPFHMEVFAELSRFTRVNLFLMNPCREYWADIKSDREISRMVGRSGHENAVPEDLHLETGNSLLASMGTLGRDFFELVQHWVGHEEALFHEPGQSCLLHCLQSDILNLRERGGLDRTEIAPDDRSIVLHSCHSPMREMEVLHDNLLALFESHPDLTPRDILVMTPDINTYAPFIQAVFDAPEDPALRIPFTITDRSIRKESHIIEGFLAILDLPGSRLAATQVLALLESTPLRRRFGLSSMEVDLIRRWVSEAGIRWGVDGAARAKLGFEGFGENSWRAGLDRLLLGFAMPGGDRGMFLSILPYDHIEGSESAVLGKLLDFTHLLFRDVAQLERSRTLKEWAETLTGLLDRFFDPEPDSEREVQAIRRTLNDLALKQELSGFDDPVGVEIVKSHLSHRLETESPGLGFITGGVTFCAMLPMRSIPFEVICLVGMDDAAFPRETRSLGFDLIARSPRPGDRSQRNDDRYLFLEALLSARRRLYVSYVGQSTEDNSTIPPSVLVSELTDAIGRGFFVAETASILEHITTKHRLQPFSAQYFGGGAAGVAGVAGVAGTGNAGALGGAGGSGGMNEGKYFSYSHENCLAAAQCRTARKGPQPLVVSGIGEPEAEWRSIDIDRLSSFFANPAKFLLTQRLHMQLDTRDLVIEDHEAFRLAGLDRYLIEQEILERMLEEVPEEAIRRTLDERAEGTLDERAEGRFEATPKRSPEPEQTAELFAVLRAAGRLPHGAVGECSYELLNLEVLQFLARVEPFLRAPVLPPKEVDLVLPPFRITGRIDRITGSGLVHFRSAKVKARDRLNLWVRHLVLNAMRGYAAPLTSTLLGTDCAVEYRPAEDATASLDRLLGLYWKGLTAPLHFFPESSYAYARAILDGKQEAVALNAARREWEGGHYKRAEGEEAHLALCFRNQDPLDAEFQHLSLEVFGALLEHEKRVMSGE